MPVSLTVPVIKVAVVLLGSDGAESCVGLG